VTSIVLENSLKAFLLVVLFKNSTVHSFSKPVAQMNSYLPDEIVGEQIPDKYLYDDQGELILASSILNSEHEVKQLVDFLFSKAQPVSEVYRKGDAYILDLSPIRDNLIDFDYLEKYYTNWLETTGRVNSMSEYGILIDFVGFAQQGKNKKYLLMVVVPRSHRS